MRKCSLWIILLSNLLMDFNCSPANSAGHKADVVHNSEMWQRRRSTTQSTLENDVSYEPHPYFDNEHLELNITAHWGHSVHLDCRVNNLNGKTVSWVRRRSDQLNLITVGHNTYSADARYTLEYAEPDNWQLFIKNAIAEDEGSYECQVSSHPPLVLIVHLTVVVPHIQIEDERGVLSLEKFYKVGSTIKLKCVIENIPERAKFLVWKHGKSILNHDTTRGGISVKTELLPEKAISRLFIANANRQDTGNYTCSLDSKIEASVLAHVLIGENPAAMQYSSAFRLATFPVCALLLVHTMLCILIR